MNEFLQNIGSPSWWVGVVVVSFIINLASAYSKPLIDRTLAGLSESRRRKLERSKLELARQLQAVEATADGVVLLSLEELKLVLAAVLCTSLSVLVLVWFSPPITNLPQPSDTRIGLPLEILLLIPILLVGALFCMRAARNKADLLQLAKAKSSKE